jgi:hypothetical protein
LTAARQRARSERQHYREGRIPYGYTVVTRDGIRIRVPDANEQAVIARMRELRDQGHSIANITSVVNREGIRPRAASAWHADVIARLLRRERVDGA